MICGNIYNIDEYLSTKENAFDLYIGSISFERRCIGAGLKIRKASQSVNNIYFIDYAYLPPITAVRNVEDIKKIREERIKLQMANKEILANLFSKNVEFVSVDIKDPLLDIVRATEQFFNDRLSQINVAERICIDISTFTKPFFFILLKMIVKNFSKRHFFIINTIPSEYTPSSLSFNIWGTEIMPAYNGIWNPHLRNALIAVLGFEGHKLSGIIDKWQFSEVIPIIGFPSFFPGLQDRALLANAEVLRRVNVLQDINLLPSLNPFECYRIMNEIFVNLKGYNTAVAPLGPKPMA